VSPQEEFECSLGSDASVRVTYQPLRRFKEVQGLLQKSDLLRFHQAIEIKNTKSVPIKVYNLNHHKRTFDWRLANHAVRTAVLALIAGGG